MMKFIECSLVHFFYISSVAEDLFDDIVDAVFLVEFAGLVFFEDEEAAVPVVSGVAYLIDAVFQSAGVDGRLYLPEGDPLYGGFEFTQTVGQGVQQLLVRFRGEVFWDIGCDIPGVAGESCEMADRAFGADDKDGEGRGIEYFSQVCVDMAEEFVEHGFVPVVRVGKVAGLFGNLVEPRIEFFRAVDGDQSQRVFVSVIDLRLFAVDYECDEFGIPSFAAGQVSYPEWFVDDHLWLDLHGHVADLFHFSRDEEGG